MNEAAAKHIGTGLAWLGFWFAVAIFFWSGAYKAAEIEKAKHPCTTTNPTGDTGMHRKLTEKERKAAHTLFKPLRTLEQYPEGHLLNPATPYTPADRTDVAATFERVRERMAAQAAQKKEGAQA